MSCHSLIRTLAAALATTLVTAGWSMTSAGVAAADTVPPNISGTATIPVYSYADAIRETVYVTSTVDGDGDGQPDRIAVDIVRPSEPAANGLKIPAIMEASPYYSCCGRGNQSQKKAYDATGTITSMPLYYDNYFVPMGYAFVGVDLSGTNRSQGCPEMGGPGEIAGAKAVIDWLNGRATGTHADGTAAVPSWATGQVGMIGKSWDGTIANGVAATGVAGLSTIVPISAISSWYDYTRFNGTTAVAAMSATWTTTSTAAAPRAAPASPISRARPATAPAASTPSSTRGTTGPPLPASTPASSWCTASTTGT